ncbi:putative 3',5'-cyclic phosphodiesterase pde-3 [Ditylenchus destructor]|uniref:3',5'-cyclic phosphodiesterase pde-3 n=1 Tax=Ditylenchus destructor TaxID=166010 RepID=A0AAD4RDI0_9BILA|nr:putative 3',5'-cyclic phosphodiesterase pde-3 [Ditylenchus destructor]
MRTQPSLNVVPSSSASTSLESSSSPPSPTIFSSTSSSFTAPEECGSNASSKFSHSQPQSILRNDLRKARHYSTEHSENGMGAEYGPSKGVTFKNSIKPEPSCVIISRPPLSNADNPNDNATSKVEFPQSFSENRLSESPSTDSLRNRRTSLPVSSSTFLQNKTVVQSSKVNEARGLIMDLLVAMNSNSSGAVAMRNAVEDSSFSPQVVSCLRAVASLLNPAQSGSGNPGSLSDLGLPSVIENPYSGEILVGFLFVAFPLNEL